MVGSRPGKGIPSWLPELGQRQTIITRTRRLDNDGIGKEYRVSFPEAPALPKAIYAISLAANTSTRIPTTIRYAANGTKPCFRTQAMNQATETYATTNETAKPIASSSHP